MKSWYGAVLAAAAMAAVAAVAAYCGGQARADDAPAKAQPKVILDFEKDSDLKMVKAGDDNVSFVIDESHATSGTHALKVTCKKDNDYAPLDIVGDGLKDWEKYQYLALDCSSDVDAAVTAIPEVADAQSTNYATRATQDDAGATLKKGKTTVVVNLGDFERNDKSGKMDLSKITRFRLIIKTQGLKDDYVLYVDNVRLSNEKPADKPAAEKPKE